jgi:tetratricopeptide (TPR) repeat protein
VLNNWGNVVQIEGDLDRAREIYMRCYAIRESVEGPEGRSVATVLNNLAMLQMAEEQHFQAEVSLRQNLAILEKHFADFPEREAMATCLNNLGMVVARQGRIEEGIEHIRKAIEIRTTRLGEDHIATARAWENLGGMLYQVDRLEEARDAFAETVRIYDKYYEEDDVLFEANPLTSLGLVYAELGEEAAALDYLDRALSIRRTRLEADDPELAVAIGLVGRYLWSIGDRDQARSLLEEAYAIESQNGVDEAGRTPALGQLPWVRVEGDADAEVRVDGSAEAILVAVPVADAGRTVAVNGPDGHELVRAELDLAQRGRPHAFLLVSPGEPLPPGRYEVVRGKNGDAVSGFVLRAAS